MAATTTRFDEAAVKALAERCGDPDWLLERRLRGLERFVGLPWPDQTLEEWRGTDLSGFSLDGFDPLPDAHAAAPTLDGIPADVQAAMGEVGDRGGFAVQLDADVVHCTLAPELAAKGVIFKPLADAAREHRDLVEPVLASGGVAQSEVKIASLSGAFAAGGAFLYVPAGVEVALPIQSFRWISRAGVAVFPRTIVVAEEGASVTYVDLFRCGELGGPALSAPRVEIYARRGAQVTYLAIQDWTREVWHFQAQRALIGRDAMVRSLAGTLGGKLARAVVESVLDEPGGQSEMLGVYFMDGEQHASFWSLQDHRAPHTWSRLNFKGALKGRSRAVYRGLVRIAKGADKSDADQLNKNLLLSDFAKADPAPFLEIEANDVKCSHGTSVGRPSDEQVFYLQSRGLSAEEAEKLIVKAFFQEVLDEVRVPEIRAALEDAVEAELELEE